ncbi:hypothetical protein SAMN05660686_03722 [Thalassobaculum litoreum DSM 18839]|uniref:Uncharacterized protein n=1 Tax=Thalassobaculum litoreum DSM 18839 TaxID=1123362 RepID=A0A8G2BKG0_9PROT|nr:hypothetical protein SAMN05660686_03722 [Thalassobaculum litoreum DSM 18839]
MTLADLLIVLGRVIRGFLLLSIPAVIVGLSAVSLGYLISLVS